MSKEIPVHIIKEEVLPVINLTPIGNWMVTTALIEPEKSSLFVGQQYRPTFLNMQRVLAVGPRVEEAKVGDWVYIDMGRFIKTVKKESAIKVGIGGQEQVTEQLVPPIFVTPGNPTTYFKITDREIEGVIPDPYSLKKEYSTVEGFLEKQEAIQKEALDAKAKYDQEQSEKDAEKGKEVKLQTHVKGANSGGRKRYNKV